MRGRGLFPDAGNRGTWEAMNGNELARGVSEKGADIGEFARMAISDERIRDEIVRLMVTDRRIMVYYHCYEIAAAASRQRPELFYRYWDDIAPLLHHANSYHRDIALTLLANLAAADADGRLAEIFASYAAHIDDEKFMTALCCVRNLGRIAACLPTRRDEITRLLLDVDRRCHFPEKQKELLKCDVIEALDGFYESLPDTTPIDDFVRCAGKSISPKTKARAKRFEAEHGL